MKKLIILVVIFVIVSGYFLMSCTGSSIDIVNKINAAKAQNDLEVVGTLMKDLKLIDENKYNQEMTFLSIYVNRRFYEHVTYDAIDHMVEYIDYVQGIFPEFTDEVFKNFANNAVEKLSEAEAYESIKLMIDTIQESHPIFDEALVTEVARVPQAPKHNVLEEEIYEFFRLIFTSEDQVFLQSEDLAVEQKGPIDLEIGDYHYEYFAKTKYGVRSEQKSLDVSVLASDDLNTFYDYTAFNNLADFYNEAEKESVKIYDIVKDAWVEDQVLYVSNLKNENVVVDVYLAGLKVSSTLMPARETITIELPYPGTEYEIYVRKDNKFYLSSMLVQTEISDEQKRAGLFFKTDLEILTNTWGNYINTILLDLNIKVETVRIDGVDVRFVYNQNRLPLNEVEFDNTKYMILSNFHRLNQLLGGYPYSEYIVGFIDENQSVSNLRLPSIQGIVFSYDYLLLNTHPENYGEGMARSWLPYMTMNTNDVSNRWVWEGLTQLIATSLDDKSDIDDLLSPIYGTELPLDGNWGADAGRLAGDLNAFISMKSQAVHRLFIQEYLKDEEHTVEDYFKSFYIDLVVNHPKFDRRDETTLPLNISSAELKNHFVRLIGNEAFVNEVYEKYINGGQVPSYSEDIFKTDVLATYFPLWPSEDTYSQDYDENLSTYIRDNAIPYIE